MNEKWQTFKMKYNKGDCLVHFTTPEEAWKRLVGLEGYAILRGKRVVDVFVVKIN
jgi:lipopolysaccharide biosynthesis glycosyltransferase